MKNVTIFAILIAMLMTAELYSANDSLLIYLNNGQLKALSLLKIQKANFEPVNVVINPQISISKSILISGDTLKISGSEFSSLQKAEITIKFPDNSFKKDTVNISSDKSFIYNFPVITTTLKGMYSVSATDIFTSKTTASMNFEIKRVEDIVDTISLNIIEKDYAVGETMIIEWYDFTKIKRPSDTTRLSADKAWLWCNYEIQYSLDSGQIWKTSYTTSAPGKLNQLNRFYHWLVLTDDYEGNIQIRIKDLDYLPEGQARKNEDELQSTGRFSYPKNVYVVPEQNVTLEWCLPFQIYETQNKTKPVGVGADGVSPVIIRVAIKPEDRNNINFINVSLRNLDNNYSRTSQTIGTLYERKKYNNYEYKEIDFLIKNLDLQKGGMDGKEYYDFWYIAPEDFTIHNDFKNKNKRIVVADIQILYKSGKIPSNVPKNIEIVRPPLMLVHGSSSDGDMWKENLIIEKEKYPYIIKPTILEGKQSLYYCAAELLKNSENGFKKSRNEMMKKGFSSVQVDYISHSMGSLMLRKAIEITDFYNVANNLYKGYVHKMISINSPHNGSYNANLLESFCLEFNKLSYNNRVTIWDEMYYWFALRKLGIDRNNNYLLDVNNALKDLKVNSTTNSFKNTTIKNHLIASDFFNGNHSKDFIEQFNSLWFSFDKDKLDFCVSELLGAMKTIKFKRIEFLTSRNFYSDMINMDTALDKINCPDDWLWHSDMIVGTKSQLGDKSFLTSSSDKTIKCFTGYGHTMIKPICEQQVVWNHIDMLLNSKMSDNYFADTIAATDYEKAIARPENEENQEASPELIFDTTRVTMTVNKATAIVGDVLEVSVSIDDTTGFRFGYIQFQTGYYNFDTLTYNYKFYIPVTNFPLDTNHVTLLCRFDMGDTLYNSIQNIPVLVKSQDSLLQITASEKNVDLILGDEKEIKYNAYFQTFISEVYPYSLGFNLQIQDTTVIGYDLQSNKFKAKKFGSTLVIANYLDKSDTTYFYVDTLIVYPNFDKLEMAQNEYYLKDTASVNYYLNGSFADTNKIHFLFYDASNPDSLIYEDSLETNLSGTYEFVFSNVFQKNKKYYISAYASNPLSYSNVDSLIFIIYEQNILLTSGWNLISSYIIPQESDSMQYVCSDIKSNMTLAKNGAGKTFIPQYNINQIGKWDYKQAYQVYMTKADTLVVAGMMSDPINDPIDLAQGWSMTAYLRSTPMDAPVALASIIGENKLLLAKNNKGKTFIPQYGINQIGNLMPGEGYQLYNKSAVQLTYPANDPETVTIGTQVWKFRNLDVSTYRNGDAIRHAVSDADWIDAGNKQEGAWCYYNNDPANGEVYGKLYNWYAVNDSCGLAPSGYHIPSDAEWTTLETYLSNNSQYWCNYNSSYLAKSLASKELWYSSYDTCAIGNNLNANNTSGFSALPGGYRVNSGNFNDRSYQGFWWSATERYSYVYFRALYYNNIYILRFFTDRNRGYSVRCVKD